MTPTDGGHRGSGIAGTIDGDLTPCWLCGKNLGRRALFCHACGAVQPPRELDPFERLGLERRFDIEPEHLDRQRAGLSRALAPDRFLARGSRQQEYARRQVEALGAAHALLREPLRRARHLLELGGVPLAVLAAGDAGTDALRARLDAAGTGAAALDHLGTDIARLIAEGIAALAPAFRADRLDEAAQLLRRLETLESIAVETRARRPAPAAPQPPAPLPPAV
jgi:molecular chaperone HscB